MKLIFSIQPTDDDNQNIQAKMVTAIWLPKGCGKDEAQNVIERTVSQMRTIALESWAADTEGREFNHGALG